MVGQKFAMLLRLVMGLSIMCTAVRGEAAVAFENTMSRRLAFSNNAAGYCTLKKSDILEVQKLMNTTDANLNSFFNFYVDWGKVYEYPKSEITGFLKLVRQQFLNANSNPTDRQILSTMVVKQVRGKPWIRTTRNCRIAINSAVAKSVREWFKLMGIGRIGTLTDGRRRLEDAMIEALSFPLSTMEDAAMFGDDAAATVPGIEGTVESTLPLFLEIMQNSENIFNKFVDIVILRNAIVDVQTLMNTNLKDLITSWKEAAAYAKSFPAKYAAFAVTEGIDLIDPFFAAKLDSNFTLEYANVVSLCSMFPPTPAPSPLPTPGAVDLDQLTPVIAIVDTTPSTLSASYTQFRARYPLRPVCVLRIRGGTDNFVLPDNMLFDPKLIYKLANRDRGDAWLAVSILGNL